jgi:hypothetical protein
MTLEGVVGEGKRGGGAVLFRWSRGLEAVTGKARGGKVALAEGCGGGLDETRGGRRPPPPRWVGRLGSELGQHGNKSKLSWSGLPG